MQQFFPFLNLLSQGHNSITQGLLSSGSSGSLLEHLELAEI